MAEYPFTLEGTQQEFSGAGHSDGGVEKSNTFLLSQGVLICSVAECTDDFSLEVVPSDGLGKAGTTAVSVGGSLASAVAAGATIGSLVPVAGTITGGIAGGLASMVARRIIDKKIGVTTWEIDAPGIYIAAVVEPSESRRWALGTSIFAEMTS